MTKNVRIENADTSPYKVLVQTWERGAPGTPDTPPTPDTLVREQVLGHPTAMTDSGTVITSGRYLVVKEAP